MDVGSQLMTTAGSMFIPVLYLIMGLFALGLYYVITKWRKNQTGYPVTAIIFDKRSDNTLIRFDRARRETKDDHSETYKLKNLKIETKPIETKNIFIAEKIGKMYGIFKYLTHVNVVLLMMNSKNEILPLGVDFAKQELEVEVPEESKLWWINSMRIKESRWVKRNALLQAVPFIMAVMSILISFLLLGQTVNTQAEISRTLNQASDNIVKIDESNFKVIESMEKMAENLGILIKAQDNTNQAPN